MEKGSSDAQRRSTGEYSCSPICTNTDSEESTQAPEVEQARAGEQVKEMMAAERDVLK